MAIAFAGSQKTLPVALFLFHAYFKDQYPLAVVPLAFYHVGQLVVDTFVADWLHGSRHHQCRTVARGDNGEPVMNRADAFGLMTTYTQNPSLVKHMLAVEAAMRAYAQKLEQDVERWGIVGLLHDFDYERWPTPPDHPLQGAAILKQHGYPEDVIYAIKSHADYLPDCPRVHLIDKALYACDELTGLITATALLRPTGIADLTAASVKKKMKAKGFARESNAKTWNAAPPTSASS